MKYIKTRSKINTMVTKYKTKESMTELRKMRLTNYQQSLQKNAKITIQPTMMKKKIEKDRDKEQKIKQKQKQQ